MVLNKRSNVVCGLSSKHLHDVDLNIINCKTTICCSRG